MTLDRACGDEQRLCDLAVGEALASELGDAALAGRQRVEPREDDPAGRAPVARSSVSACRRAAWRPRGGRRRVPRGGALALRCADCAAGAGRRGRRGRALSPPLNRPARTRRSPRGAGTLRGHRRQRRRRHASPRRGRVACRMPGRARPPRLRGVRPARARRARDGRAPPASAKANNSGRRSALVSARPTARKSSSPSATRPCATRSRPRATRRTAAVIDPLSASESSGASACSAASSSPWSVSATTSTPAFRTRYRVEPGARSRRAPSGRLPRRRSDRRVGARASRGGEADSEPAAVAGRPGLCDRGIEQRPHLGVPLGPEERERRLRKPRREHEPRRVPRPRRRSPSGEQRPGREVGSDLGGLVRQDGDERSGRQQLGGARRIARGSGERASRRKATDGAVVGSFSPATTAAASSASARSDQEWRTRSRRDRAPRPPRRSAGRG